METVNVPKHNNTGRALGGLLVVAVGIFWLLKQMHFFMFPTWLFTLPMFFIALGLYIGIRKGFTRGGWLILILGGAIFLFPHIYWFYTGLSISEYTWPLVIIVVGLFMILRPRHDFHNSARFRANWRHHGQAFQNKPFENKPFENWTDTQTRSDDYLDETSVFGGINKVVVSKNFKGGDIVNIFGGCDLNLTQADFTGTVTIDAVQIFGGTKIIVPTDWKIIIKTTSVFGGVEDKRPPALIKENPNKTLIIDGTSIFAGISIQCY